MIKQDYVLKREQMTIESGELKKVNSFLRKYKKTLYIGTGIIWFASGCLLLTNKPSEASSHDHLYEETNAQEKKIDLTILNYADTVMAEKSNKDKQSSEIINQLAIGNDSVANNLNIKRIFKKYCAIYQVDEELVYQKACQLTDNFTNQEWIKYNQIKGTKVCKQERTYSSSELGILVFVRHIIGFKNDELTVNTSYKLDVSYEEFTQKVCFLLDNLNPLLCQAIQNHESGNYTSNVFFNYNNPAGIRKGDGKYWNFDNPAEGILECALQLEYRYFVDNNICQIDNAEDQIIAIQKEYCPLDDMHDIYKLNKHWIKSVTDCYNILVDKKEVQTNTK